MAADSGCGTTVGFQSGFLAEILDVNGIGYSRKAIDTTHFGSTYETQIPSCIVRHKQLRVQIAFDPDVGHLAAINAAAEDITVTFPIPTGKTGGAKLVVKGFMTDYEVGVPMEERMTADCTLVLSGTPVWTDAT